VGFRMADYLPKKLRFAQYYDYNYQLRIWRILHKKRFYIMHCGNDNSLLLKCVEHKTLIFKKKKVLRRDIYL